MPDRHDERAELLEQTLRSSLLPRRGASAADAAHRRGVLRSDEGRILTGACAAIGRGLGVGPRLVRLLALCLTALGPGPFLYCLAVLLLPRTCHRRPADLAVSPSAAGRDRGGTPAVRSATPDIEYPLRAMARGDTRPSEVLAVLLLVPSLLIGGWWFAMMMLGPTHLAALLVMITAALAAVLGIAALRAARARQILLMAVLAREAGFASTEELTGVLTEARRRAPYAWAMIGRGDIEAAMDPDHSAPEATADTSSAGAADAQHPLRAPRMVRPRRDNPHRLGGRSVLAAVAAALALGASTLLLLNAVPTLVPSVALAPLLPQVGRIAAASGVGALLLAVVVIVAGLRGRRSVSLTVIAALAVTVAGVGAVWLRLTRDPEASPVVIALEDPEYGGSVDCPAGIGAWRRPVVIDLRGLDAKDAERIRAQAATTGDDLGGVAVFVGCYQSVGRVTVLMPQDPTLVDGGISTVSDYVRIGQGGPDAVVGVTGSLFVGYVTVVDHETAGDTPAEDWAAGQEE